MSDKFCEPHVRMYARVDVRKLMDGFKKVRESVGDEVFVELLEGVAERDEFFNLVRLMEIGFG